MKCETPVSPASAGNTGSASGTRSPGGEVLSQLIDKAAGGSPSEGSTFAKLLVSNVITGTLIGKNGKFDLILENKWSIKAVPLTQSEHKRAAM